MSTIFNNLIKPVQDKSIYLMIIIQPSFELKKYLIFLVTTISLFYSIIFIINRCDVDELYISKQISLYFTYILGYTRFAVRCIVSVEETRLGYQYILRLSISIVHLYNLTAW